MRRSSSSSTARRATSSSRALLLGYDVLYLLRGAPTVYYGDEVGMIGSGGDKEARQDMFPTQVDEWKTEQRVGSPPIGDGSSFDVTNNPIELRLKELGALKDAHPALSTGAMIVRRAQGGVLVVSRIDWSAKREYVVALNSGGSAAQVSVPTSTPSSSWAGLAGTAGPVSSGADGALAFTVPATGASVYEANAQIPSPAPPAPTLKVGKDDFSTLWRAAATVTGKAPVTVSFAIKRKPSAGWQLLAADDTPRSAPSSTGASSRRSRRSTWSRSRAASADRPPSRRSSAWFRSPRR